MRLRHSAGCGKLPRLCFQVPLGTERIILRRLSDLRFIEYICCTAQLQSRMRLSRAAAFRLVGTASGIARHRKSHARLPQLRCPMAGRTPRFSPSQFRMYDNHHSAGSNTAAEIYICRLKSWLFFKQDMFQERWADRALSMRSSPIRAFPETKSSRFCIFCTA